LACSRAWLRFATTSASRGGNVPREPTKDPAGEAAAGDLRGQAAPHPVALLLVDVINPLDFPEADAFLEHALPAAEKIAALRRRAAAAGAPVIYANDNFGRWQSNFLAVVERCLQPDCQGRRLCELLKPGDDDYFVLKPRHSAFYSTTLELLLRALQTRILVI